MSEEKEVYFYRCDFEKNKNCLKTECQTNCFFTANPENSVDGKRYVFNVDTFEFEAVDT